jgi:hypothetical protein
MQDYTDFPPKNNFIRVLKSCPRSALLYAQLWKKRDLSTLRVEAKKEEVRKQYLISPTLFRNLLEPLMALDIVSFVENDEKFRINVSGVHSNE